MNELSRLEIVYGKENIEKLRNKKIVIIGLGGVGSYAAEAIARCFINNIILIDFDKYDKSNLNRQLHSSFLTIGSYKVEIIKNNIYNINNNAKVKAVKERLTKDNIELLIPTDTNYVIDAIDDFTAKIDLIDYCNIKNINIISCMGTGNKTHPEMLKYSDIYKTTMCPMARKIRKELKSKKIKKLDVVYSIEKSKTINSLKIIGSTCFVPATAGMMLAAHVVNKIIESEV